MDKKKSLLVVSHVLPLPGNAGQQMRVRNKLIGLAENFHVTFLTTAHESKCNEVAQQLSQYVDEAIVLPSLYSKGGVSSLFHKVVARLYAFTTSLKASNYAIGLVELSPERVAEAIEGKTYDLALFEYWHAYKAAEVLHAKGVRCVLDMHDILSQTHMRSLNKYSLLPKTLKTLINNRYKRAEERAWNSFDSIIAINKAEEDYLNEQINPDLRTFYAPMGTNMTQWQYRWDPENPPRLAYYGGLGNPYNQKDALTCYNEIMPSIWDAFPDAQLWLVGSEPSQELMDLADNKRVFVTGFVEDVQSMLGTMSVVLCPFSGTFGFRSRLIEVLALGVPLVSSEDASYGMDLEHSRGVFHCKTNAEMIEYTLKLLGDAEHLARQSRFAREMVEEKYSFDSSYGRLAKELSEYCDEEVEGP